MIVRTKGFAGVPRYVMNSPDYMNLSGSAAKLLYELCYQLTKENNGDLTCAYSVMKERGFRSRTTVEKARDELLKTNLILETRRGRFLNPGGVCALYAVTWLRVYPSHKRLDVQPTKDPKRKPADFL